MDPLQILIIIAGLSGQVLIARKHHAGYVFWIVGNLALMFVYYDLHQYGLAGLQVLNTAIQMYAVSRWIRDHRENLARQALAV